MYSWGMNYWFSVQNVVLETLWKICLLNQIKSYFQCFWCVNLMPVSDSVTRKTSGILHSSSAIGHEYTDTKTFVRFSPESLKKLNSTFFCTTVERYSNKQILKKVGNTTVGMLEFSFCELSSENVTNGIFTVYLWNLYYRYHEQYSLI